MKSSTARESSGVGAVLNWVSSLVKMLVDRERAEREREMRELKWRVDLLRKSICQHDRIIVELGTDVHALKQKRRRDAA
jgi:hypothetical protein